MKFMLFFAGGDPRLTVTAPESKEKTAQMKRWADWTGHLAKQGLLLSGLPLLEGGKVVTREGVEDFHKRDQDFSGFVLIEVPSEADAVVIAGTAPHIYFGGTTVVRECGEVPH